MTEQDGLEPTRENVLLTIRSRFGVYSSIVRLLIGQYSPTEIHEDIMFLVAKRNKLVTEYKETVQSVVDQFLEEIKGSTKKLARESFNKCVGIVGSISHEIVSTTCGLMKASAEHLVVIIDEFGNVVTKLADASFVVMKGDEQANVASVASILEARGDKPTIFEVYQSDFNQKEWQALAADENSVIRVKQPIDVSNYRHVRGGGLGKLADSPLGEWREVVAEGKPPDIEVVKLNGTLLDIYKGINMVQFRDAIVDIEVPEEVDAHVIFAMLEGKSLDYNLKGWLHHEVSYDHHAFRADLRNEPGNLYRLY